MAAKFQQNAGTWLPFNLVFFKKRQIKWQPSSSLLVLGCHLIWCFLKKTQIYFFHRKIKSAIFLFFKKKAKYGSQIPAYGFFEFPVAGERLRERRHMLPRPHAPAPQAAETLMRRRHRLPRPSCATQSTVAPNFGLAKGVHDAPVHLEPFP